MYAQKMLKDAAFDAETTKILVNAFEEAWHSVQKSGSELAANGHASFTRTTLAKHIIAMGAAGELNPRELIDGALAHLAITNLNRPVDAA